MKDLFKVKHCLFALATVLLNCYVGFSQNPFEFGSLTISATILDKETSGPIPYATIYNQTTRKGTISDFNGSFSLEHLSINDSLSISFVGYEKKIIIVSQSLRNEKIYLQPKTELLNTVLIYANNSFLYDLIFSCKKSQTNKSKNAKTYYVLETTVDNKQVELVESYYNGEFSGYDTQHLFLKNGRIALADFNNRFFVSTESSKAMYLHELFNKNGYFPASPFELSKNKLRKKYNLTLESKYLDSDSTTIYVIDYVPEDTLGGYFRGRVWIDSLNKSVIKVNLHVTNATIHPFLPHGNAKSIAQVDLDINKTFQLIGKTPYVNSVDFNYQIIYESTNDSLFSANTNAVLYAFDFRNQFLLPKFEFSNGSYEDYRKINAAPYNKFFWDNIDDFGMKSIRKKNDLFIKNNASVTNQTLFINNSFFEKGFFEHPYVFWSENRIKFRESPSDSINNKSYDGTIPTDRYHLEAQIYLDINEFNDSLHFITKTIFDPFKSFYHYPLTSEGVTFINMYFDLVEIYQRNLAYELQKEKNEKSMIFVYNQKIEDLDDEVQQFFKDVEHGTNKEGMLKWNTIITTELGLDNIDIFGLYKND